MTILVTDKRLLRRRAARAHERMQPGIDFLMNAVIAELVERLAAIEANFPLALASGGQSDRLAAQLHATGRIGTIFRMEPIENAFLDAACGIVADEEALPIGRAAIDLMASALSLQWANDLPGALVQIRRALKPGGLFLAALTGGQTLQELREALFEAEVEVRGGASPRVLPRAELADLGGLLQRTGFVRPVADREILTVRYGSPLQLAADLKAMGASNALAERDRRPVSRQLLTRMSEIYAARFSDADGRIRATFEIITLTGWAPEPDRRS